MNFLKKIYYEKYTKKSYSISNVDLIINRMFSKINNGVYIDIGCNHPIKFNNTYLLYKRGWKGINLDLDEKSISEFNILRPKDHNLKALISTEENIEKEIFFYHDRSAINTVSKNLISHRKTKIEEIIIIKEKTTTINRIIENSPFQDKKTQADKRQGGHGKAKDLWPKFVDISFYILKQNGLLCFIHPPSWRGTNPLISESSFYNKQFF